MAKLSMTAHDESLSPTSSNAVTCHFDTNVIRRHRCESGHSSGHTADLRMMRRETPTVIS